jgi:hypothetical protein
MHTQLSAESACCSTAGRRTAFRATGRKHYAAQKALPLFKNNGSIFLNGSIAGHQLKWRPARSRQFRTTSPGLAAIH